MPIQKPPPPRPGSSFGGPPADDAAFAKKYPSLWEYLTEATYADGSDRQTASLIIFLEDGVLKLCVSDRDTERTAFFTSSSIAGLWEAANRKLGDGTADWRGASKKKGKGTK